MSDGGRDTSILFFMLKLRTIILLNLNISTYNSLNQLYNRLPDVPVVNGFYVTSSRNGLGIDRYMMNTEHVVRVIKPSGS